MVILPDNHLLEYSGRIDFSNAQKPLMIYPCTYVRIRFTGSYIAAKLRNIHKYWDNYVGCILDGEQRKYKITNSQSAGQNEEETIVLGENLSAGEHECILFKRQDACHLMEFLGFILEEGADILALPDKPDRRIEIYGDSVSAGEVSEAIEYVGKKDPAWHQGELSNSWYSYSWILARMLHAEIHDIAQGGAALLDGTGWFHEPDYIGMQSIYDKIQYQPDMGAVTKWDFTKYRPHVVIVAIGQNDSHPKDYMKEHYDGEKAEHWRSQYIDFIRKLRNHYPMAEIILTTTILQHDASWDDAIEEVCRELSDERVHHFLYHRNGVATPGHIRIPEAEEMAEELKSYIESLGEEIWNIV